MTILDKIAKATARGAKATAMAGVKGAGAAGRASVRGMGSKTAIGLLSAGAIVKRTI